MIDKILVATDGSASSTDAVQLGVELAATEGAFVLFAHVVPEVDVVPVSGFGIGGAFPHEPSSHDWALLADAAAVAAEHGVPSKTLLLRGDTVTELVTCADANDVDLIVVGSRGRGAVASALLGSVARGVLHAARRPVLITPRRAGVRERRQPVAKLGLGL
jgi:nucleotide-binding universal stress UspA family protein